MKISEDAIRRIATTHTKAKSESPSREHAESCATIVAMGALIREVLDTVDKELDGYLALIDDLQRQIDQLKQGRKP